MNINKMTIGYDSLSLFNQVFTVYMVAMICMIFINYFTHHSFIRLFNHPCVSPRSSPLPSAIALSYANIPFILPSRDLQTTPSSNLHCHHWAHQVPHTTLRHQGRIASIIVVCRRVFDRISWFFIYGARFWSPLSQHGVIQECSTL